MRTESTHERDTEDHEQEPRQEEDGAQSSQPTPMTRAGVSPAAEPASAGRHLAPVPDEAALAADDAPSEGRARRAAQDENSEAGQDDVNWDGL